jgi:hypothetical protein
MLPTAPSARPRDEARLQQPQGAAAGGSTKRASEWRSSPNQIATPPPAIHTQRTARAFCQSHTRRSARPHRASRHTGLLACGGLGQPAGWLFTPSMLALKPADAPLGGACAPTPGEGREEGGADETGFRGQPGHGDEHSSGSGGDDAACDEAPHTWLDSGDSGELQLPGRELLRVVADGLLRGGVATQGWEGGARAHVEQAPHRVGGPIGTASTPSLPVELDRTTVRARSTVRRTARAVEGWAAGGLPLGKPRPGPVPPRDTLPHAAHHPTPAGHDTRHAVGAADGGAATVRERSGRRGRERSHPAEGWGHSSLVLHRLRTLQPVPDSRASSHRLVASTRCVRVRRSRPGTSGRGISRRRTLRHASTCRQSRPARRWASA